MSETTGRRYELEDLDKIEIKGDLVGHVYYKPRLIPILTIVVGLGFLFTKSVPGYVMCGLFVFFGLMLIFIIKDRKVISVYSDCVLVYSENEKQAVQLFNDEILEWDVNRKAVNQLYIRLKNGLGLTRISFRLNAAEKFMNQTMKEKNVVNIQKSKGQDGFFKQLVLARQREKKQKAAMKAQKAQEKAKAKEKKNGK